MSGHKSWGCATRVNIPSCAHVQHCAIGRKQRTIHCKPHAVLGPNRFGNFIFQRMLSQCPSQPRSIRDREAVPEEEDGLAAADRMRRIEEIPDNFVLRDGGLFGVRHFHARSLDPPSRHSGAAADTMLTINNRPSIINPFREITLRCRRSLARGRSAALRRSENIRDRMPLSSCLRTGGAGRVTPFAIAALKSATRGNTNS